MARFLVAALLLLAAGDSPARAEAKFDRAQTEARLKTLFPSGERNGQEGVMKIGGQFRSVGRHRMTWQQCRDLCRQTPSDGTSGCALWTYIKADDAKMPNVCRMWWTLPDLRANPAAVSGAGKVK
jgi:hypothetical protein